MRKPILLVSGCSFTTDYYTSLHHPELKCNWPKWPELLADKMGMEVVNLGRSGAGQEYIFASLSHALATYGDRVGYVIAAWSQVQRRDYSERINDKDRWTSSHFDMKGDIHYYINRSMMYYYQFQTMCEYHNVQYKQFSMIEPFKDYLKGLKTSSLNKDIDENQVITTLINNPYYDKIKEKNFIGWPLIPDHGGYNIQWLVTDNKSKKELQISETDSHPSALGHEKYAEFIYENL